MENTNNNAGKWVLALVVIAIIAGAYLYVQNQNQSGNTTTQEAPASTAHLIQGTVTAVDTAKLQITIETSTTSPAKIVTITPATKIQKIISQKDASDKTEKQASVAVDVSDVQKGTVVTISYQTDTNNVLGGVESINFTVEGNIDAFFKTQAANQPPYLKGQVISIDIAGKVLQYKAYFFDTLSTTTVSVAIPDGIPVYRVSDPAQVAINYVRTAAALADIKPEQIIFVQADPAALKANKIVAQAFIISAK